MTTTAGSTEVDVLIVGAGLSGIGAACHLVREETGTSFAILERRAAVGGTWDLFSYPGIRSGRGSAPRCWPTVRASSSTSPTPPRSTASPSTSGSAGGS